MLLHINWDVSEIAIELGRFSMRWYGLMFAMGFSLGYIMVRRSFFGRGLPEKWLDWLFFLLVICTILGARLGHVFFYDWDRYSRHPGDILKVWEGGLASHGGVIGGLIAVWIFSRFVSKKPYLWVCDRLAAPVALTAGLIRLGNLMNSEIVGTPSEMPWAFHFINAPVGLNDVPRHPVQLYEAISYLIIFMVLFRLERKATDPRKSGLQTGFFFLLIFSARFVWEFFKSDQGGGLQAGLGLLSTGQWLSLPLIALGAWLVFRSRDRHDTALDGVLDA